MNIGTCLYTLNHAQGVSNAILACLLTWVVTRMLSWNKSSHVGRLAAWLRWSICFYRLMRKEGSNGFPSSCKCDSWIQRADLYNTGCWDTWDGCGMAIGFCHVCMKRLTLSLWAWNSSLEPGITSLKNSVMWLQSLKLTCCNWSSLHTHVSERYYNHSKQLCHVMLICTVKAANQIFMNRCCWSSHGIVTVAKETASDFQDMLSTIT